MQHSTENIEQYSIVQYNTVQYYTVLYPQYGTVPALVSVPVPIKVQSHARQGRAEHSNIVHYCAEQSRAEQYSTVLCKTVQGRAEYTMCSITIVQNSPRQSNIVQKVQNSPGECNSAVYQ